MSDLKEVNSEVVGTSSSDIQHPARTATRKSTRTKPSSIPKSTSPSGPVEALTRNADEPRKSNVTGGVKRRRSISNAAPSRKHPGQTSAVDELDEQDEASSRRSKKPSTQDSKTSPAKGNSKSKGKDVDKQEKKPKKMTKAAMERAKLEELRSDDHFGKLDDAVIKRIVKVSLERMYLIHRFRNGTRLREEFDISGSKGNVYKVTLDRQVNCSCMDFALRHQVCKHLMFVYIKVLRLQGHLPVFSRIRLTEQELNQVFDEALENPTEQAMANPELRKAWESAVGYRPDHVDSESNENAAPSGKRLIPEEGDVCGVCYEDLEAGSVEGLEFCLKSCGRPIHTDCLETWLNSRGLDRTCIWCRARWHDPAELHADSRKANGYGIGLGTRGTVVDATGRQLNLAAAVGLGGPAP